MGGGIFQSKISKYCPVLIRNWLSLSICKVQCFRFNEPTLYDNIAFHFGTVEKLYMCGGMTLTGLIFLHLLSAHGAGELGMVVLFCSSHVVSTDPSFLLRGRTPHSLPLVPCGIPPRGDSAPWTLQCGSFPCSTRNLGVDALSAIGHPLDSGTRETSCSGWRNNTLVLLETDKEVVLVGFSPPGFPTWVPKVV